MGNLLHANAKTTPRIRKEIQESKESQCALAKKFNINVKTVKYWKNAGILQDKRSGPQKPVSVLSEADQEILVEFRRNTKMSLDDIFIAFRKTITTLSRSNLHRLFVRNGISRLPKEVIEIDKKKFKDYPPGFVHIDITEVRTSTGRYYLFVAIDRTTKYIYAEIYDKMTQNNSCIFLENFLADYPIKVVKILTDNGAQFTYELLSEHLRPKENNVDNKVHPFDKICQKNGIEHRLIKFRHPWTNGQVEIYNKIIKNATIKQFFYESLDDLKRHMMAFLLYFNYQKPCKQLKYISPYQKIIDYYKKEPTLFKEDPMEKIVGLNI
jgi:transposase InsO family protein